MHLILKELQKLETQSLALLGEPGIGKTSVAKAVANFLKFQNLPFLTNGVLFLTPQNISSLEQLEAQFLSEFTKGLEGDKFEYPSYSKLISSLEQNRCGNLLVILDNVEEILNVDAIILKNFIDNLVSKLKEIKILMTSKTPV